jgi:hypothetical protein
MTRVIIERRISANVLNLSKPNRNSVLIFLQNQHVKIATAGDGSRVNLSKLPLSVLTKLDELINSLTVIEGLMRISI